MQDKLFSKNISSSMFENYVEEYKQQLVELIPESDLLTISQLSEISKFPKEIRNYLNTYIAISLSKDVDRFFDKKDFDITDQFNHNKNNYLLEFAKFYKLDKQDLLDIISSAVEVRFNYLIRPQITLATVIYDSELPLGNNKDLAKWLFSDYNYLLQNIDLNSISKDEFIDKIKQEDNNYIYDLEPKNFLKLLFKIYKLFSFDGLKQNIDEVPIESLIVFFDEKEIAPLVEKLADLVNEGQKENITKDELVELISEISGVEKIDIESISSDTSNLDNNDLANSIDGLINKDIDSDDFDTSSVEIKDVDDPLSALSNFLGDEGSESEVKVNPSSNQELENDSKDENEVVDFNISNSSSSIDNDLERINQIFSSTANIDLENIEMTEANSPLQKEIQELVGDID